ncbi:hypothetical protein KSP40_PGU005200 [Platanthera guangdongensis]|uniref:Uncharacterized protein n=1 Tax=Platanthera guangdongensis TaxID=2320717 RepID=A0ABR2MYG0_9ASPA
MGRSGEDQVETKRPRRCVQSKLSFSVSPQAGGPQRAPSSPDAASDDGGSDYEVKKNKGNRKRSNKMKSRGGDPEEPDLHYFFFINLSSRPAPHDYCPSPAIDSPRRLAANHEAPPSNSPRCQHVKLLSIMCGSSRFFSQHQFCPLLDWLSLLVDSDRFLARLDASAHSTL